MTDDVAATRNFVGALNDLRRVSGLGRADAALLRLGEVTARLGLPSVSRSTFYNTIKASRVRCPDWSEFCRPLVLACLEAAGEPGTTAYELELDLGREEDWRRFHALASNGTVVGRPFQLPEPNRAPGLSEQDRLAGGAGGGACPSTSQPRRRHDRAKPLSAPRAYRSLVRDLPDHRVPRSSRRVGRDRNAA
jgi:hypothetical protein